MSGERRDAVVIGAGHNGLVAAAMLADAGWSVLVLEEQDRVGGAVHSDTVLHPDFVTDWFSAFYPLTAASPVIRELALEDHGLRWTHAPAVLAHVLPDDRCAVLGRDVASTAANLDTFAPGDGAAWQRLVAEFEEISDPLLRALFRPFPPVRPGLALARSLGTARLLRFLRLVVAPVRRIGEELFAGEGGRLLLAGNALHSDLGPDAPGSAVYGWLLAMLAQTVGFPVPIGGAGALAAALAARAGASGAEIRTGVSVEGIEVAGDSVVAVRTAAGERIAARSVLADVPAPTLYRDLVGVEQLPARFREDLDRFQWDASTLKVDWALSRPIGWSNPLASGAGTVHLGTDVDGLTRYAAALATRELPADPFVVLGQMTTSDAGRSPEGTESAWGYTHVPAGGQLPPERVEEHVAHLEAVIERHAPGFASSILARRILSPTALQAADGALVGGAMGGGTANIHQQLVFRPVPGLGRAETPVDRLYLASSSAHPGGGVHGGPGSNAARAALLRERRTGRAWRGVVDAAQRRIYSPV